MSIDHNPDIDTCLKKRTGIKQSPIIDQCIEPAEHNFFSKLYLSKDLRKQRGVQIRRLIAFTDKRWHRLLDGSLPGEINYNYTNNIEIEEK